MRKLLFLTFCLLLAPSAARALDNGVARTPPMGWNSWNKFGCDVDEAKVRSAADGLVASGMKQAGYVYVVIDDCWQGERTADGWITADARRFPAGIAALSDYVHAKGLLFGIYSDTGTKTCAGRPGSRGYEYQDALQYARWKVDYLKYDWCNTSTQDAPSSYATMRDALAATGRPIVFSICEWGTSKPWQWGPATGNLWRTTGDIGAFWEGHQNTVQGITNILDLEAPLAPFAGPGHWNDPDMLEVGNGKLTLDENRSHFSLWAELAAPLIAGNDLSAMPPEIRSILTNAEVIAVDQDVLGKQGERVSKQGDLEVWSKTMTDGGRTLVLFNRSATTQKITANWQSLGLPASVPLKGRDLWQHKDLGMLRGSYAADVAPHGVQMVRLLP